MKTNLVKIAKTNKGITLIALIITIILLLILAGISIASLTGENGILNKTSNAQEKNQREEYKEILTLIGNRIAIRKNTRKFKHRRIYESIPRCN